MPDKILFVDDEENVLSALKRQFRKTHEVHTAVGGAAGLEAIARGESFAVIVADMQMPEMNGVEFLREAKKRSPDSQRLMLTGNADQKTATDAVNEGCVFRFLNKPCPPDLLASALEDGIEQHRLINAERELLEGTLNGSIKLLTDILSIVAPESFGKSMALRKMARSTAGILSMQSTWNLEVAAMFSNIAYVTIPAETLERALSGGSLSAVEQPMIDRLPEVGSNLLANIPRLEKVARIVLYKEKHFDGGGFPEDNVAGDAIPLESRILKVLSDLERLKTQGMKLAVALQHMAKQASRYDPAILEAVSKMTTAEQADAEQIITKEVKLNSLQAGHVLLTNIETEDGKLLYNAGKEITATILERLYNFRRISGIQEPIKISMKASDSDKSNEAAA